jgi:phage I-like protein
MGKPFKRRRAAAASKQLEASVRSDGAVLLLLDIEPDDDEDTPAHEGEPKPDDEEDVEGNREPPKEFRVLADGTTLTTKGPMVMNQAAALSVVAKALADGRDELPIDYGHGMLAFSGGHDNSRAAGWFRLEARGGELWASSISWTPTAKRAFADREYRFFSPALLLDSETRVVTEILNIALTNIPATLNQVPLVADARGPMDPNVQKLLLAMGATSVDQALAKFEAVNAEITTLLTASQTLQTEAAQAQQELATVRAEQEKGKKTQLIEQLSRDGKLSPALKTWADTQTTEQLTAFGQAAPVLAPQNRVVAKDSPSTPTALSDEQRKICKSLGITEQAFLLSLQAQSQQEHPLQFKPLATEAK